MIHQFPLRVYYEDTDLGGIVYYANYLKFIERGRSEWVREIGVDQVALKLNDGVVFAVRHIEADYYSPARYDDELVVTTAVESVSGARWILRQTVERDGDLLFKALVTIVAINDLGVPTRLPAVFRQNLN
ncbi:MAG: tol-pal system-associated acyl-CoA thioesterase [Octadecabacter sp.]|nr:tol-pal system-associated acyl-CoA thioesterase [Octadecabacter sp.]